jgi:hydroxymethylpyrimidine pyrophosphatase-like HAD family hydrolase
MRSVVFTDLDETLLHSRRRRAPGNEDTVAAVDSAGAPLSYQTERQAALFRWMRHADRVIPVTGRSVDAYRRVRIPFAHEAIVHHGAMVLRADGTVDHAYAESVRPQIMLSDMALSEAWEAVQPWIRDNDAPFRVHRKTIGPHTVEVCVKHVSPDAKELGAQGAALAAHWQSLSEFVRVHHNGNNLALLPRMVDKRSAVIWVRTQLERDLGPLLALGAGDSGTDHPFLSACDFYVIPSGSQLDVATAATGGQRGW